MVDTATLETVKEISTKAANLTTNARRIVVKIHGVGAQIQIANLSYRSEQ